VAQDEDDEESESEPAPCSSSSWTCLFSMVAAAAAEWVSSSSELSMMRLRSEIGLLISRPLSFSPLLGY